MEVSDAQICRVSICVDSMKFLYIFADSCVTTSITAAGTVCFSIFETTMNTKVF